MQQEISPELYQKVASYIKKNSALDYSNAFHHNLKIALNDRTEANQLHSCEEYYFFIQQNPQEYQELIQQLTIGETYFFRYTQQFDFLRNTVFPEYSQSLQEKTTATINIWSAACSSGEEPYSIAMTVHELFGKNKNLVNIFATDIDHNAIQSARQGIYRKNSFRSENEKWSQKQYFVEQEHSFQLQQAIINQVQFQQLNFLELENTPFAQNKFHVIFCRNALIYFSQKTVYQLIERFHDMLLDGGYLFLGPAEYFPKSQFSFVMEPQGHSIYRKIKTPEKKIKASPQVLKKTQLDSNQSNRVYTIQKPRKSYFMKSEASDTSHPNTSVSKNYQQLYEDAFHLYQQKSLADAEKLFKECTSDEKTEIRARIALAHIFSDQNKHTEALEQCQLVLQQEPVNGDAYFLMGMLYQQINDFLQAEKMLRKSIYCQENHYLARYFLAGLLEEKGERNKAQKEYQNIVNLSDNCGHHEIHPLLRDHTLTFEQVFNICSPKLSSDNQK